MGKKAERRRVRDLSGPRAEPTWVVIGSRPGEDLRGLLQHLHSQHPWLSRVDDRSVRLDLFNGGPGMPCSASVSVRSDHLPPDWEAPEAADTADS